MLKVKRHQLEPYLQYCHTAYALLDIYIYMMLDHEMAGDIMYSVSRQTHPGLC